MKKFILRWTKRLKVMFTKKMRSSIPTHEEEVEPYEKTAFKICLRVISDVDSEFMIAPMSGKRFINNEKMKLFVLIDYNRIEITNHVFHYNVKLTARDRERISYIYDLETEKRRTNLEKEVKGNIKNSLDSVLQRIETQFSKKD